MPKCIDFYWFKVTDFFIGMESEESKENYWPTVMRLCLYVCVYLWEMFQEGIYLPFAVGPFCHWHFIL